MSERPQRNLALELVRATEAAAMVAARHAERGEREHANIAASRAMRVILQSIDMDGVVVIGEGEKRDFPLFYHGELVGTGQPPAVDVAVDPIEGTPEQALRRPNTLAMVALADRWSMWDPGPCTHVEMIVTRGDAQDALGLGDPAVEVLHRIADALHRPVQQLTVFVLEDPRHRALIEAVWSVQAQLRLNEGGFVLGAILAAMPDSGVDVMWSVGTASEAVLAAAAVKALGGALQVRCAPQSPEERARVESAWGPRMYAVFTLDDLIRSDDVFFAATGITDGALLHGVRFRREQVTTESVVMRGRTGTVRYIRAIHRMDKLMRFSSIDYTGDGGTG